MKKDNILNLLKVSGFSQQKMAERLGMTRQNFNQKLVRETFTDEELYKIASICDADYVCHFKKDGKTL